ncbi:MAG: transcription-repair coupling factor [Oscillospiraceae bacterium]
MNLLPIIEKTEQFEALKAAVTRKGTVSALFGVYNIHRALYAGALCKSLGSAVVLVTESDAEAVRAAEDMRALCDVDAVFLPSRDLVFLDVEGVSHESELMRLSALGKIADGRALAVCCSVEAFCQLTMPKSVYRELTLTLNKGEKIDTKKLAGSLVGAGYTRCDRVDGRGQFALRGGIIDIFPADRDNPLRIELFGSEIDAISEFDVETQRRFSKLGSAVVTPAREVVLQNPKVLEGFFEKLPDGPLREAVGRDLQNFRDQITPACTDRYLTVCYEETATVLDWAEDAVVFVSDSKAVSERYKNLIELHTNELESLLKKGLYSKQQRHFYADFSLYNPSCATVLSDIFAKASDVEKLTCIVNLRANIIPRYSGELSALCEDLNGYLGLGFCGIVLVRTQRAVETMCRDLTDNGISAFAIWENLPQPGTVGVAVGALSSGFELFTPKVCVFSGSREALVKKPQKQQKSKAKGFGSLEDLHVGDYLVHQNHGIGRFDGIHRIDIHGYVRDYIKIKYRDADTLYVPVTQLDMVSPYISPKEDENVKLAKLHSNEWANTKQTVYRAVREMAKELIELYAKREKTQGVRFSDDDDWQRDFEARFIYDETDDQLRAADEIKRDMENEKPMDRLLCGDVGVGKTEVALRAAFKCVNDGYQCAVLVPTTILAWQHFRTFRERLETYLVKTAMLSRFSTAKQIKEALEGIKNGTVDIAIGTHRLIQKDVSFKKPGLLIVDEEQRFGVAHKEKLKQAFAGIDVLTLSATPIPRTLNMAMQGIRDMSVIEQPPEDRQPVLTQVLEYDEGMLSGAIKRELSRGGQVYFLHNRVESIERTALRIKELVPEARVEIAHGKMGEEQLSEVWRKLLDGECDVLVCTTIIETGVDVPNVNTLIVEDADKMGLSQLYQIRGRVGRSGRRAFAYFTFRRDKVLTDIASKRLSAIRDFTSFGSGFKIAMRDLQIRGAGSVLSARQSGHMQAVGYDTYIKILNRAIADERGEEHEEKSVECLVDLAVDAYIPESYIPDNESRIELYKQIAAIESEADAVQVREELADRFGEPPACVLGLVNVSLLRISAGRLGIYEISEKNGAIYLFSDTIDRDAAWCYIKMKTRRVLVSAKGKSYISLEHRPAENAADVVMEALSALCAAIANKESLPPQL